MPNKNGNKDRIAMLRNLAIMVGGLGGTAIGCAHPEMLGAPDTRRAGLFCGVVGSAIGFVLGSIVAAIVDGSE
jgi:hypothetical protein